ncbi:MAG TPA: hypothetical protein VKV05_12175, partial [Terriglobales bacterium]|nr:hypothetical protein [Terriglobales bacterium]
EALHLSALTDSDIWWHLSSGLWMLQNHALPHTGLFSQSASLPWVDASWGFDLLVAGLYQVFGLVGLPILLMLLQVAVAIALFQLGCGGGRNFWAAVILAAVAQYSIAPMRPRPALCSLVLLACELALLLEVRRSGNTRALLWMPLLFFLWANLDRQFSYGVLVLTLFGFSVVVERLCRQAGIKWFEGRLPEINLGRLGLAVGASLVATLFSPYTYHLHAVVWQSAISSAADRFFPELHSMRFHRPQDYLLMLLVMTAFFAQGRRRSRDLFLFLLLIVFAVISFRWQRDAWLVVVAAVGAIGNVFAPGEPAEPSPRWRAEYPATAVLVLIALVVVITRLPNRGEGHSLVWSHVPYTLWSKVEETFPVSACDYIRRNHLPQPLFNAYSWGGFLTWYLPEYPVLIDGRTELYGDTVNLPYFQVMDAEVPLESYPGFAQAQTFLLEANSPMAEALAALPAFHVAYQDNQAMVLVRAE